MPSLVWVILSRGCHPYGGAIVSVGGGGVDEGGAMKGHCDWGFCEGWGWGSLTGFPLGLENLEKMGRHFPVREKSGNFEQTGKVGENHTKYWKNWRISDKYYLLVFSDI